MPAWTVDCKTKHVVALAVVLVVADTGKATHSKSTMEGTTICVPCAGVTMWRVGWWVSCVRACACARAMRVAIVEHWASKMPHSAQNRCAAIVGSLLLENCTGRDLPLVRTSTWREVVVGRGGRWRRRKTRQWKRGPVETAVPLVILLSVNTKE